MDRSQKKCLLAATGGHALLFVVVAFGSAFLNSRPDADELPKLKFVPTLLVDLAMAGGGGDPSKPVTDEAPAGGTTTPVPTAPPLPVPPAPEPEPTKAVEPPAPAPQPPPPDPTPEPPKVETPRPTKITPVKKPTKPEKKPTPEATKPTDTASKTPPKKPSTEIDLNKIVTRPNDDVKRKAAKAEADRKALAQAKAQEESDRQALEAYNNAVRIAGDKRRNAVVSSLATLGAGFSSDKGVKVDVGGPGGVAYANYGAFVVKAYDTAWILSPSLGDSDTTAEVSVTVLRTGEILNARISRRSGMPALDKSVETALARVRKLPPFPEGSTDEQRTFTIRFNLKSKRQSG